MSWFVFCLYGTHSISVGWLLVLYLCVCLPVYLCVFVYALCVCADCVSLYLSKSLSRCLIVILFGSLFLPESLSLLSLTVSVSPPVSVSSSSSLCSCLCMFLLGMFVLLLLFICCLCGVAFKVCVRCLVL